ncbi:carboxypeptidase regulatory-like domain-containing protein [Halorubellus salinus]|uniref:carboxypeptidase regulatory-like domain-containing protein n=1 Tax=Halorubellus salinus TaxID=755309 RepID=UPI001D080FD3|nr:carboxypeptidase regulatory-like domain-containing protein [Halorubellus salinus]
MPGTTAAASPTTTHDPLERTNSSGPLAPSHQPFSHTQATNGGLEVTVRDADGYETAGVTVVLYDTNWDRVGSQTTASNGQVSWSDLSPGEYNLEAYHDGEFWGGVTAEVTDNTAASITLRRNEPYEQTIDLTDEGNGDGTISIGDPVNIATQIRNDKSYSRDVRVKISIDTNNDDVAETTVTRGPLTINSNDDQWYGTDFTPDTSGTHQVRVQVETAFGGNWAVTDDTGWQQSFTVQSNEGTLELTVEDTSGHAIDNARVTIYDSDYDAIDTQYSDSNGDVSWTTLTAGTYYIETYADDQYLGGSEVEVTTGSTTTTTLQRYEPYEDNLDIAEQGDGDGTFEAGETAVISPRIRNDASTGRAVRVQILVDTDNDGNADQTVTRGPQTISSGDAGWYGYEHPIEARGTHQVRVLVETEFGGDWVLTDDTGWEDAYTVQSSTGGLDITVEDESGQPIADARVVLYDDDWEQLDTAYTDADGGISWTSLSDGSYHIEVYADDRYLGGLETAVQAGSTTTRTIQQYEPYESALQIEAQGDGDGVFERGETAVITPRVRNDASTSRGVRVQILVDTDNDDTAERRITRGPLTIDSGGSEWYGYEHTIDASATHQVRVLVETEFGDSWVITDDTGWQHAFDVQSTTGNLDLTITDASGATASGIQVVLYDEDWNRVDTKYTDASGDVVWADLNDGQYHVETYADEQYWGGLDIEVQGSETTTRTIQRYEPYADGVPVEEQGDGDGRLQVGETALITPSIVNDASSSRSVRVQILVDTDNDGSGEQTVTRGPITVGAGDREWFGYEHAISSGGTQQVRVLVETEFGDSWVQTDDTGWHDSMTVQSDTGTLELAVEDKSGTPEGDVELVLYDDANTVVDSTHTNTDGRASFSELPAGSYHVEMYADGLYWGGDAVDVEAGATTSTTLQRHEPYPNALEIRNQDGGDGTYEVGETVLISPRVRNDAGRDRSVRVQIFLDTDNDGRAEETITRGPVDVASAGSEWFGYEHELDSGGPSQVRVAVETIVNDDWVLTADTGWVTEIDVASSTGGLKLAVEDSDGSRTASATVVLYDDGGNKLDTQQTNSSGETSWQNLTPGTYYVEVYADGAFWATTKLDVESGEAPSLVVERQYPLTRDSGVAAEAASDGNLTTGERVPLDATVENPNRDEQSVRVAFLIDADGDGAAEETVRTPTSSVPASDVQTLRADFTPTTAGPVRVKTQVETRIGDDWVRTASSAWGPTYTVSAESNNSTTTSGFDMAAVTQPAQFIAEGDTVSVTVQLSNPHDRAVTRTISVPGAETQSATTTTTVTLDAGATTTHTFAWTPTAASPPASVALKLSQSSPDTETRVTTLGSVIVAEELVDPTVRVVGYGSGEPVTDADVTVTAVGFIGFETGPSYDVPESLNGTEIEPGVYEFGPLPRDLQLSVLAEKPGYKPTGIVFETGESDLWGGDREITIPRYVYPTVAVETPDGEPVSGVTVELSSDSYPSIDGETKDTNSNGLVSLGRIPNGTSLTVETPRKHDDSYFVSTTTTVQGGDVITTTATPLQDPSEQRADLTFGPTPDPGTIAEVLETQVSGSTVDARIENVLDEMSAAGVEGTKVTVVRGSVGITVVYANVTEWRRTGSRDAYMIVPYPTSASGGVQTLKLADKGENEVDRQLTYLSMGASEGLRETYSAKRSSEMDAYLSEEIGANVYVDRDSTAYKTGRFISILAPLGDYGAYKRAQNRGQTNKAIWSGGWVAFDVVTLGVGGKFKAAGQTLYKGADTAADGIRSLRKVRRFKAGTESLSVTGKEIGRRVSITDGRVIDIPQIVRDHSPRSIAGALRYSDELKQLSPTEQYRFVTKYYSDKPTTAGDNPAVALRTSGLLSRDLVVKAATEGIDLRALSRLESTHELPSETLRSYVRGGIRASDLNALLKAEALTVSDVTDLAARVDPTSDAHVGIKWTEVFAAAAELRDVDGFKSAFRAGDDSWLHQLKVSNYGGTKGIPTEMTAALRFGRPQIRAMDLDFSAELIRKTGTEGEIDLILDGNRLVEVKSTVRNPSDITDLVDQMENYEAFAKNSDRVDADARLIVVVEEVRDSETLRLLQQAAREHGFEIIYRSTEETPSSNIGPVPLEDRLGQTQGHRLAIAE